MPLHWGYNVPWRLLKVNPKLFNMLELAAIHFVSRPKPWEAAALLNSSQAGINPLVQRWHDVCAPVLRSRSEIYT